MASERILICDDDEDILEVTRVILDLRGYDVVTCTTCDNILELLDQHQPKLVLMDLWIPELGGEAATRIIKATERTKHLPVIIFSANNETEKIANQAGADAFICKPFEVDEIEQLIRRELDKASPAL